LHHVVLERWSRGASPIHRGDPRVKIVALLAFLLSVATTPNWCSPHILAYGLLPVLVALAGRLPLAAVLIRAGIILPFCAAVAVASLIAGDAERAAALTEKSYVSALAVLTVVGTTPMPRLLSALESLGVPRFLVWVIQFLHRYLFVVSEQAQHMRLAADSRALSRGTLSGGWHARAASSALAVLFSRSYKRAEGTYRAMLSRSFEGRIHLLVPHKLTWGDGMAAVVVLLAILGLRLFIRGL
jgi:cobalt/nickel transport system permease protein